MKPNQLIPLSFLVAGALAAVLTTGCGGGQELEAAHAEVATFSNKLAQAESRADMAERTAQTALTNLVLAVQDFAALSNRCVKLKTQLSEAEGRGSIAAAQASQGAARITELEAQQAETVQLINELRGEKARIAAQAEEFHNQIAGAKARAQAAINEREILEARIAEMEALLNNSEWLRAQLSRARAASKVTAHVAIPVDAPTTPPTLPQENSEVAGSKFAPAPVRLPGKASLEMLPDGSVRLVAPADGSPNK